MATEDKKYVAQATLRYEVQNISTLDKRSFGPISYVRGLPWRISIVPYVHPADNADRTKYLSYHLQCLPDRGIVDWSCSARAVLRCLSQKNGVDNKVLELDHLFNPTENNWGYRSYMDWKELCDPAKGYSKDDVVIFEVLLNANMPYVVENKRGQFQRRTQELKEAGGLGDFSFRSLFPLVIDPAGAKDSLSDVTLRCQDKSFNCHRVHLAQISTTFRTMFTSEFAEGNKQPVVIEDITPETMLEILRFIYCGYVETDITEATPEIQHEFLYAAEKYDLKALLELLVIALEETLDPQTACRYAIYADRFSLAGLKKSCFTVMAKPDNRSGVVKSPNWDEFVGNKLLVQEYYCFTDKP